jgi:2-keto-4-pentenoate hydratase/2-oxohepta-3-ene-1,7-dioic acid hydratase in catechol pathway
MRLCRFGSESDPRVGFYDESRIVPLREAAGEFASRSGRAMKLPDPVDLLDCLPHGTHFAFTRDLAAWVEATPDLPGTLDPSKVNLLVPVPRPNKIFLLAGNYAEHIREGGGIAAERAETFPYVFMKPSTTLTATGQPIKLPAAAPDAVDWELELAVIIGRRAKRVSEAEALNHVAGYAVVNDVSQRRFRPNPGRKKRERDAFFDWLHGKWFDSFCAVSGAVASADTIPDPQQLPMRLDVNGLVKQDATTAQMIFPVAAVVSFISDICTLEPGDIISTGTPAGVGVTRGEFLKAGDRVTGWIERIGTVSNPVEPDFPHMTRK